MNDKQLSFDMKIARRLDKKGKLNENGCYTFSEASINNIPYLDIFIEVEANSKITEGCKAVLRASISSKNQYRFGEIGLLISLYNNDIKEFFTGNYNKIQTDNRYNEIIVNRNHFDLAFIHNHPNNSRFSSQDLISFSKATELVCLIAVGNTQSVHVLYKSNIEKSIKIKDFIKRYISENTQQMSELDIKRHEHDAITLILNNTEAFGIEYYRFNRRNIQ